MDYKYIEQLLERYWECQTTLEEEQILRTFFHQESVPQSLLPYKSIFLAQDILNSQSQLPADFEQKMLGMVGEETGKGEKPIVVKARRISLWQHLRPFYQAAGLVALLLTIGMAAQHSMAPAEDAHSTSRQANENQQTPVELIHEVEAKPSQQSAALPAQTPDDTLSITR